MKTFTHGLKNVSADDQQTTMKTNQKELTDEQLDATSGGWNYVSMASDRYTSILDVLEEDESSSRN